MAEKLGGLIDMLQAQEEAGLTRDEVLASMCASWSLRLRATNISGVHLVSVTRAISQGPWAPDQRAELARLAMSKAQATPAAATKRRTSQTCTHFHNFVTEFEWGRARSLKSKAAVLNLLSVRAWMVGLILPSEPTIHHMVAILAYIMEWYDLDQSEVKALKDELNTYVFARRNKAHAVQLEYLAEYPVVASDLPAAIKGPRVHVCHRYPAPHRPPQHRIDLGREQDASAQRYVLAEARPRGIPGAYPRRTRARERCWQASQARWSTSVGVGGRADHRRSG